MAAISASGANNFIITIFPRPRVPLPGAGEGVRGPSPDTCHPLAGICVMGNKSHRGRKAGGKVSPCLFWRGGGGLAGLDHPPGGCWRFPSPAVFHGCNLPPLAAFRVVPRGSSTGGHVAVPILFCWGEAGRWVPMHRSPGRQQAPAQSPGSWYGPHWGLVWWLLGTPMEVLGTGMGAAGCWYRGHWEWAWSLLGADPGAC